MNDSATRPDDETLNLPRVTILLLYLVAALVVLISVVFVVATSGQPLLDLHSFRQTQTALTSYWFSSSGWRLDYWTPVAGAPWSIPFEFPVYQALVAFVSDMLGSPLDKTGRLVSYFFLLVLMRKYRMLYLLTLLEKIVVVKMELLNLKELPI